MNAAGERSPSEAASEVRGPARGDDLPALVERLRAVEKRLGRPVRALFIGNIANNAFHLAKMVNRLGIACDCICYDYYHIMGCPEWEDADFEGDIDDDFHPVWTSVDMRGYERPHWFVQGPLRLCQRFLEARLSGDERLADHYWRRLAAHNRTVRSHSLHGLALDALERYVAFARRYYLILFKPDRINERARDISLQLIRSGKPWPAAQGYGLAAIRPVAVGVSRVLLGLSNAVFTKEPGAPEENFERLERQYRQVLPDRQDALQIEDLGQLGDYWEGWRRLLSKYDIVQGFSTDPIIPMLAGSDYFAFEHGTLREIPYRPTPQGRLTSLAYHNANRVFVTNSDCLSTAHKLAGDRVSFINHPYDEEGLDNAPGWREYGDELRRRLQSDHVVLHPTRQDWVPGTGYADKANDVFLKSLALMRSRGVRVGAVLCRWGANVEASERLLQELGIADHVLWVKPMPMRRFFRTALATGVVVDQFKLGAIGGVAFKALAAGVPVCTSLDEAMAAKTFGSAPPVLNCATTEDLARELPLLLASPQRMAQLGESARAWFKCHHSGKQVTAEHLAAYLDKLERRA